MPSPLLPYWERGRKVCKDLKTKEDCNSLSEMCNYNPQSGVCAIKTKAPIRGNCKGYYWRRNSRGEWVKIKCPKTKSSKSRSLKRKVSQVVSRVRGGKLKIGNKIRNIYEGPRGGEFVKLNGNKVYVKSLLKRKGTRSRRRSRRR